MKAAWIVGCLLALGCGAKEAAPAPAPAESTHDAHGAHEAAGHEEAATEWAKVQPAAQLTWLEAPARALVPPDARALVSVPLAARVTRVRVRPGDLVTAGQPVVDVTMPELIAAAGALSAASIRLSAFEQRHARLQDLLGQGLARAAEVAELEAQMALARADRESARATLRAAGVSDEQAAGALASGGSTALRAPIAGTVTAVSATLGEVREPSSGPLVELAQSAGAQIEARFAVEPRKDHAYEWIGAAQRVPLVLEAVSPTASGESGARVAWLRAATPEQSPAAGALGRVRLVPPASWVVVPATALVAEGDGHALRVEGGDEGERVPVKVVMQSGADAVVEGVAVGQRVAVPVRASAGGHFH